VIVYRVVEPVDEFGDLLTLPEYLAGGAAESTRWAIRALLELADTADELDWRGDMRHLPSVATASDGTACLIVKQDDDGAAFLVSA
jgi:hypothetical protein